MENEWFKFFGIQNDMLKYHMQWKHFKEKSCCDECGYQTKTIKIIKRHKLKSLYMEFNYPCDKCYYEFTLK